MQQVGFGLVILLLIFSSTGDSESQSGEYIKVFSHDVSGGLWVDHEDVGSKNEGNPEAKLYSILNQLEDYRTKDGKFKFKLCYPELTWGKNGRNCNEWYQTSNPYTEPTISGFEEIYLAFGRDTSLNHWGGLGKNIAGGPDYSTVIDDSPTHVNHFSDIGCKTYWPEGQIPGPRFMNDTDDYSYSRKYSGVTKVVLYVEP